MFQMWTLVIKYAIICMFSYKVQAGEAESELHDQFEAYKAETLRKAHEQKTASLAVEAKELDELSHRRAIAMEKGCSAAFLSIS